MTSSLASQRALLLADPTLEGLGFAARWCEAVDSWLSARFAEAAGGDGCGPDEPVPSGDLALVAVGGYGRGDLAPGSDLDLVLLHRGGTAPGRVAERIWYPIWDDGLKLGHSVRTVRDALRSADEDLVTATSLLSCRHLAGDPTLTEELASAAARAWREGARRNLEKLRSAVMERHTRVGEVAFLLEPDLKDGQGGLRDVHALRWAQAARSILEAGDEDDLSDAEEVLFETRVALHRVTGRSDDQLTLQEQDEVASVLGTTADGLMAAVADAARSVSWIADETWHRIGVGTSSRTSLLGWRSRHRAPGLVVSGGQVHLEPSADPASRPELVFDAAILAASKKARISRAALVRLAQRTPPPSSVWDDGLRQRFVSLLGHGHDAIGVIESLDRVGLWERYLPEWTAVRNRPQRNAYHRYTVDRHLLEAAAAAASLTDRVTRSDLLLLASLLHDIGKGHPGDHTEVGMELVAGIGPRMGLGTADTETLVELVRLHLLLPTVATRRDLSDEATTSSVAAEVGDRARLGLLHALTEADSSATGPAAWGSWKAELVGELVRRVDHALGGGDPVAALGGADFPDAEQRALMAERRTVIRPSSDGASLLVITVDRPGTFSRTAGVLALHGLDVRAADAASEVGMSIQVHQVSSRFGPMIAWDRIVPQLTAALDGRLALEARLGERIRTYERGRRSPGLPPPLVHFDDEASATATVVELQAPDRQGLLYRITRALADFDLDVRVAKVQTLGEVVVDAFYVTRHGAPVAQDPDLRQELQRALIAAATFEPVGG